MSTAVQKHFENIILKKSTGVTLSDRNWQEAQVQGKSQPYVQYFYP